MGAEAFHGPVRDGKGWFHLAMGTRLKGVYRRACGLAIATIRNLEEVIDWMMGSDCSTNNRDDSVL